jgi:HEAT repeat protein
VNNDQGQRALWFWRSLAVAAVGCSAYLAARPAGNAALAALPAECRPAQKARPSTQFAGEPQDGTGQRPELDELLLAIRAARPGPQRCAMLMRLAHQPSLEAAAVEMIGKLAQPHGEPMESECAISALGELTDATSLEVLLALSETQASQYAAVQAMARRPDATARKLLLDIARDPERPQRMAALTALTDVAASEVVPLLIGALDTRSERDRYVLVTCLGRTGDPRALPRLAALLSGANRMDQVWSIEALGLHQSKGALALLLKQLSERPSLAPQVVAALGSIKMPEAEATLLQIAEGSSPQLANGALSALMSHEGPAVGACMLRLVGSGKPQLAEFALNYLSQHPSDETAPALMKLCTAGQQRACMASSEAWVQRGGEEALDGLLELAEQGGPSRSSAMLALMRTPGGAEDARALALEALSRGGMEGQAAIEVLGNDDSPEARRALLGLATGNRGVLSAQAIGYLARDNSPDTVRTLERLVATSSTDQVRSAALGALVQSGAASAGAAVEAALQQGSPAVRAQAAQALVELRGPAAESALVAASRSAEDNPELLGGLSQALGQLGTPGAAARLAQIAGKGVPGASEQALYGLAQIAPERAGALAETLIQSKDEGTRLSALGVSTQLDAATGARVVLTALRTSDENLVRQAMERLTFTNVSPSASREALERIRENSQLSEALRSEAGAVLAGYPSTIELRH